jgi:hypothetical protein
MHRRTAGIALAVLGSGALACSRPVPYRHLPSALPAVAGRDAPGLPSLPEASPRNASYSIDARLDPDKHTIAGSLVLEWRNTSGRALDSFPFHLYWNAFRNNLSTAARDEGRRAPASAERRQRSFGWIEVRSIRRLGDAAAKGPPALDQDLTPTIRYLDENGNTDDRTVFEVRTQQPVAPDETVRFRIEWDALVPHGSAGRAGWVHDYNFIVQWFPKIGVFWKGAWNAHPFYPWTEFFADFGVYDVRLTLPRGFVVGATGRLQERRQNGDASETFRFVQEDVHDFAWTASRRFLERRARFDDPGYPPVEMRLLLQPEHAQLAGRYLEATRIALRDYGTWSAPYPYPQITVVDPAWGSASGGMEYPTLFTGGSQILSPPELHSPEGVTVHEAGHQFWYGLVANNEFEEAWLDEGFNTYMTSKAIDQALGPPAWGRRFGGGDYGRGARTGWPFVAPSVRVPRGAEYRAELRSGGQTDVMARPGWTYRNAGSYVLNSYGKPALALQTLEGLLGEETMVRVLRTYARRFRFAHATTADFIATVNETTGQDWQWFFDQTFFSSDLCDYGVLVDRRPARAPEGWFEGRDRRLELRSAPEKAAEGPADWRVTIVRYGDALMPVELRVEFEGGRSVNERWDGKERWKRFEYAGARLVRATVDPGHKLAIDVDPVNNEWIASEAPAARAATKWSERLLLWLQTFLELNTALG